jgi:hypothetical protein
MAADKTTILTYGLPNSFPSVRWQLWKAFLAAHMAEIFCVVSIYMYVRLGIGRDVDGA